MWQFRKTRKALACTYQSFFKLSKISRFGLKSQILLLMNHRLKPCGNSGKHAKHCVCIFEIVAGSTCYQSQLPKIKISIILPCQGLNLHSLYIATGLDCDRLKLPRILELLRIKNYNVFFISSCFSFLQDKIAPDFQLPRDLNC